MPTLLAALVPWGAVAAIIWSIGDGVQRAGDGVDKAGNGFLKIAVGGAGVMILAKHFKAI